MLGSVRLAPSEGDGSLGLAGLFDLLHAKAEFDGWIAPGWRMTLTWA